MSDTGRAIVTRGWTAHAMLLRRLRNAVGDEGGTATIEVAAMLPMLVLMLLAALDFGVLLEQDMTVADSARVAAQYASIQGQSTNLSQIQLVASSSAASIAGYRVVAADVCTCGPGGALVSCTGTCSGYGTPSEYVTVTATASLPLIFGLKGFPVTYAVQSVAGTRVVWTHP